VNQGRGTVHPLQETLQVEEKPWVTDEDVQAAGDAPEWPQRDAAHSVLVRTRSAVIPRSV
jgi:hypothetical protein